MFISVTGLQFSFLVLPLPGFGIRVMVASQNEFGSIFFLCNFLKEFQKDRHQLFSKCLIEFSCETIWPWAFVSWEIFYHSFNFGVCNWVVYNLYFFQFSLGRLNFSKNLSISSRLSILLPYSCSQQSLIILCISALSVVTSPFSFLILLI